MKTVITVKKTMNLSGRTYQPGDTLEIIRHREWREMWFTPKGVQDALAEGLIEKVKDGEYKVLPGKSVTYSAYTYHEGDTFRAPDIYDEAWSEVEDKAWTARLEKEGVIEVKRDETTPDPEPEPTEPTEPEPTEPTEPEPTEPTEPEPTEPPVEEVPEVTGIKMSQATKTAAKGDVFKLSATLIPEGSQSEIGWTMSDGAYGNVHADTGEVTVAEDAPEGTFTVTAHAGKDGKITGTTKVTVK